jgi:hypothetical protein
MPDGASNGAGGGVLRAAAMILRKGPLPGAKPVIDREEAKVVCRGCSSVLKAKGK